MNYYEVLEVSKTASQEIIKIAYKNLAKKHHPDIVGVQASTEKMKEINEAYEVLSNIEKRKEYDEWLFQNSEPEFEENQYEDNIHEILSKVSRMYPEIIKADQFSFNSLFDLRNSLNYNKGKKYLDVPSDCEIYIYYYNTRNTSYGLYTSVMAITNAGIYAFSEKTDTSQKFISWQSFKNRYIKYEEGCVSIGGYLFDCNYSDELMDLLNYTKNLLNGGFHYETEEEERTEIVKKKIKSEIVGIVIWLAISVFCYFKGWNNWLVKVVDACSIGYTCYAINDILDLYIDNGTFRHILRWGIYGIGAFIWYKLTR